MQHLCFPTWRHKLAAPLLAAAAALPVVARAELVAEVEGVQFPTSMTVEGTKLVLNGAAVRKRGYFKPDAVAVYLPAKASTLEAATRMAGPKRLRVWVLRELPGSTISRYFVNDFKLVTTDDEFKQLIPEVGQIGSVYASLPRVSPGDVFDIDWIPGKGTVSAFNGKPMMAAPLANPKMFEVTLRLVMGAAAPQDMREQLLGQRPTPMVEVGGRPAAKAGAAER